MLHPRPSRWIVIDVPFVACPVSISGRLASRSRSGCLRPMEREAGGSTGPIRHTWTPSAHADERLPTDEIGGPYRDGWARGQAASNSSRRLVIGQAPSE